MNDYELAMSEEQFLEECKAKNYVPEPGSYARREARVKKMHDRQYGALLRKAASHPSQQHRNEVSHFEHVNPDAVEQFERQNS